MAVRERASITTVRCSRKLIARYRRMGWLLLFWIRWRSTKTNNQNLTSFRHNMTLLKVQSCSTPRYQHCHQTLVTQIWGNHQTHIYRSLYQVCDFWLVWVQCFISSIFEDSTAITRTKNADFSNPRGSWEWYHWDYYCRDPCNYCTMARWAATKKSRVVPL